MADVPTLTPAAVRRAALAAQGFGDRPQGQITRRQLRKVLDRIQLIQLDSVNVAVRAHYMPLFSRLGRYDRMLLDEAAWSSSARRPRLLAEYWAHEASLFPIEDWPLLRSGAKSPGWWARYGRLAQRSPQLVDDVLAAVKELGPISAGALERTLGGEVKRAGGGWWNRSDIKWICEWLFGVGELTTGTRVSFQRLYDLTERVIPPDVLACRIDAETGARELIDRSARALGVATAADLRDYYRLSPQASRQAIADLVDAGVLEPVQVLSWRQPAYRHVDARIPRSVPTRALLCPFDPLIWERDRTERIFGFHYRIEIYVPEHKRVHGYYVFPFLLDGELVARVDLKADRVAGVLRVPRAFAEPQVERARVSMELAAELRAMAEWLGLEAVVVGDQGDLASALRVAAS